ncbi:MULTISPECIES: alpha/beta fold hydrolase [unclassified Streptomyces]|uniref:esterase/lipase family protein n=1 Tax=Streptomyces TaxID=1883 RepID=UPI000DC7E746|nr:MULTISPECIES: alpha/beta fold hydrolase [unclassified Streptomyces]AWZ06745.1 lipase [Streptomyces sp. ICC4]AWZ16915.1 lipase [Streptomyces sp. ICC1]
MAHSTRASRTRRWLVRAGLPLALLFGSAFPAHAAADGGAGGINDFSCRPSAAHPEPVVLLHGTFATWYEDLNFLQADLAARGYCTFALTYGAYEGFPLVGGLKPVAVSNLEIKAYVEKVRGATGAAQVSVVGHSEGGLQALYLAKMQGIQSHIKAVVAIAPPTHGTNAAGLLDLGDKLLGRQTMERIVTTIGIPVLADEVPGGPAILALNNGPVAQPGISYTIISSRYDELVTPTETAFVREPGVRNQYVQDFCPFDPVGHIGEAYDLNVWHLVRNGLDPRRATPILVCAVGSPG